MNDEYHGRENGERRKGICAICGDPLPKVAEDHYGTHSDCQREYEKKLFHKEDVGSDVELLEREKEIDFDKLIVPGIKQIDRSTIVMNRCVRAWCCLPYSRHPKGCPKFNVNPLCPPVAPYRGDITKRYDEFFLIYVRFDMEQYIALRKTIHPDYSTAQLRNLIYWQKSVKKRLNDAITKSRIKYKEVFTTGTGMNGNQSMESAGVFVFATLQRNQIPFERKADKFVTLVALTCGYKQIDLLTYLMENSSNKR